MPEPTQEYYEAAVKAWKERDALQEKLNKWIAIEGDVVAKLDAEIIQLKSVNRKLRLQLKKINSKPWGNPYALMPKPSYR